MVVADATLCFIGVFHLNFWQLLTLEIGAIYFVMRLNKGLCLPLRLSKTTCDFNMFISTLDHLAGKVDDLVGWK